MTGTKYQDIRQALLADIEQLQPGDTLPRERDLAERFGASRMTVRKALETLVADGRIYASRGYGTFVADPKISKDTTLTSFSQDMIARGLRPGSRLLKAQEVPAGPIVGRDLEIPDDEPVFLISRLRLADDLPMCLETVHLPARFFPKLLDSPLDSSLYELLATRFRTKVASAEQTISVAHLSSAQADLLGLRARSSALAVGRRTTDSKGRLIERAESLYRPDRYAFYLTVRNGKSG